ncbi:hypothetical protein ACERZ8_17185 [Tateyamaria armeniaca]|uniref:DUF2244 domain-containing protein n=1 Tax=Tateyamaria armeniaca TaxID=2518930 RepID=A0ABW8UWL1_9RHOB
MTAITDISTTNDIAETPRMVDGMRWMTRGAQRLGGVALVLSAIGLWVMPGMSFEADLALFKLGVSVALGFAGLAIMQAGRARRTVKIEIDTVRREVRLVRGKRGARDLVSRTAIADLGPAEIHGNMARLWTMDGALVAEVAMSDPNLRRSLMAALRDAGKI